MLVLTRRLNESVYLGGSIRVKVVDILDGRVRLGIEAPPEVGILRDEHFTVEELASLRRDIETAREKRLPEDPDADRYAGEEVVA